MSQPDIPESYLRELSELRSEAKRIEQRSRQLVCLARDAGATWRDIGGALGTSPQAAVQVHQRWQLRMYQYPLQEAPDAEI